MSEERKPYDEEAAQARRLAILSELAQSRIGDSLKTPAVTTPTPAPPGATTPAPAAPWRAQKTSNGRRRVWWILSVSLVALLALGFAGLALLRNSTQSQQPQKAVTPKDIALTENGLTCPRGAAWSPAGKNIAVVGYKDDCPNNFPNFYRYHPGALQIYDATGALLSDFPLDAAIQPKLGLPPSSIAQDKQVIYYGAVTWSPDGKRVAVSFAAFEWAQIPCPVPGATVTGVAVTAAFSANGAGAATHAIDVFARSPRQNDFSTPVWDLQEARALNESLVHALGYQWNPNGYLTPDTPLAVGTIAGAAPSPGPVGVTDGTAPFTIWQSGVIQRYGTYSAPIGNCQERLTTTPASPYTFRADFSAWSPDDRYFAPDAGFEGLVQPPGAPRPDPQALSDLQLTREVNLPVRDAALERALNNLGNTVGGSGSTDTTFAQVSWRPDGKALAVYHAFSSTDIAGYDRILTLYDCATGKPLGDLTPPNHTAANQNDYQSSRMYWTRDGARLLLMDAQTSTLRIWGAGLLPK
jgi:hypothetical protein